MTHDDRVPPKNLQRFVLDDLRSFTKEGVFSPSASRDFRLFYVGRDDVHGTCAARSTFALSRGWAGLAGKPAQERLTVACRYEPEMGAALFERTGASALTTLISATRNPTALGSENPPWTHPSSSSEVS